MLSRTWRITLLIIAGIFVMWPNLLFLSAINWITLIAVVILLIGELTCKSCGTKSAPMVKKSSGKRMRR